MSFDHDYDIHIRKIKLKVQECLKKGKNNEIMIKKQSITGDI